MKNKIKAGIIGGAGYTGGETIRLLLHHPEVELIFIHSRSQAGAPITSVHTDLIGDTDLQFSDTLDESADVWFICLGHGDSKKFLETHRPPLSVRIIDLGNDFRLGDAVEGRSFVYGLPEMNREKIKPAFNIANPGCFATAIQLGLLPLASAGLLTEIHTTGITGSTGAGQKLQETTHFTWRANNISPYKALTHQHVAEINQSLRQLQADYHNALHFVPWRGDFTRGILVSSIVKTSLAFGEVSALYRKYYHHHSFTHVSDYVPDLKQVVNTNKCLIGLEMKDERLVIHSVIDNLLKGASGQAVQNMNLMFGLEERTGLNLKPIAF
ncbi:MAG: N-acetyl-gamma-glutamyl-phosphate reductase [Cyclobacteriaceae bacterium]|jgi:N-acetyl-gamma-glutamyl-phosphate reductase|nr:N-acetyl-gamma-glutamyl-phosphate reductase [Cyclobacteriaceae bacterium]